MPALSLDVQSLGDLIGARAERWPSKEASKEAGYDYLLIFVKPDGQSPSGWKIMEKDDVEEAVMKSSQTQSLQLEQSPLANQEWSEAQECTQSREAVRLTEEDGHNSTKKEQKAPEGDDADKVTLQAVMLLSTRMAMQGAFPLNGTYFQ